METSIRYGGDSKALKIHAKEELFITSNTRLQVHGELDTKSGAPSYLSAMIRHFYPDVCTDILHKTIHEEVSFLGVGVQYDRHEKLRYNVRGKKSIPVTTNGVVLFNIKGRFDVDKEFKQSKARGAAEFTLGVLDFQDNQDVRLKVGYEVFDKVPYMQIKENNWTLNVNVNGKWNVRYDL